MSSGPPYACPMAAYPSLLRGVHPADGAPRALPLVGHALAMAQDPLGLVLRLGQQGEVVPLRLGTVRAHLVASAAGSEAVLRSQAKHYSRQTRVWSVLRMFLGDSILLTEGPQWKSQRRVVNPAFHRRRLMAFADTMRTETDAMLAGWRDGQSLDVADAMMHLTLRIVSQTLFGTTTEADAKVIASAVDRGQRYAEASMSGLNLVPVQVPTPRNRAFLRAIADLDRVALRLIQTRREELEAGGAGDDVLTMLLEARTEDGEPLPEKQVRDEVITLLSAGHETTANALAWTFYRLSRHPEVLRTLTAQIDEALGGEAPTPETISRVPYARWVFDEALRVHPPAWITGRLVKEPHTLVGVAMRPGDVALVSPYVVHRQARYFANPEGFDPARWETLSQPKALPPFAFFPFGGGPRKCIGEAFAYLEALLVLIRVLQRFELELVPGHPVVPAPQITLGLAEGLRMTLRSRAKSP